MQLLIGLGIGLIVGGTVVYILADKIRREVRDTRDEIAEIVRTKR